VQLAFIQTLSIRGYLYILSRVYFPAMAEFFKGFSLADQILLTHPYPRWQKMAQSPLNGTTQPVDIEEEG